MVHTPRSLRWILPLLGSLLLAGLLLGGRALAAGDDWPRYGHDGALTGRTSLTGDLVQPHERWSISLAGGQWELELTPAPGKHALSLSGNQGGQLQQRTIPLPAPLQLDVDGTGSLRPVVETAQSRWARILPGVRGWQQTRWTQTGTTAKVSRLELIAYDQGQDRPRTVWRSEPEGTVFAPLVVVDDIDDDGVLEICVAMHYRVLIYEGTTGRKETELRFHTSRSYGWFGLADVDADGQRELVVLADFQSHFDVLNYDPSQPEAERLSVRWRRDIEQHIEDRKKWPQIGPRPVVDVCGDGRPEIVVNLFNDTGDGQWHTVVLEAASGKPIVDLPQRYTQGNGDVDGDGRRDLFCAATRGPFVPDFGQVEIVRIDRSVEPPGTTVLWSHPQARFGLAELPHMDPTWATGATQGMRHVLLSEENRRPAFLVQTLGKTLDALRYAEDSGFRLLWSVGHLTDRCETLALTARASSAAAVVRVRLPMGAETRPIGQGAKLGIVGQQALGTEPFGPIAARFAVGSAKANRTGQGAKSRGAMHVLVEGAAEHVFAIRPPPTSGSKPAIVWQRPGHGMGNQLGCLAAADLDGSGSPEVVVADRAASGAAVLATYHANGQPYWQHVFEQTPGARPVHNVGALAHWWPGHFRATANTDLFVNTRTGLMHSDVGHLLDGRTGATVWTRRKATIPHVFSWGYTGVPVAVADLVGDQRDELVNLYPVCYWIADGATGRLIEGKDLAARQVVPAWAAYGEPIVWDFSANGQQEILLDSPYILALLDVAGNALWHGKRRRSYPTGQADDNLGETTSIKHALVDFDGDGRMEIASGGYRDGVRAIDPVDGTILWTLAAPTPTGRKCAAADIDGNGGEELLYVAGNRLVAVSGNRQHGRLLWTWQYSSALSLPAIADLDDDGRAEIVLQSADGVVHCLDGPAP